MPQFTSVATPTTSTLGNDAACHTNAQCVAQATTQFPGYDSYSCTGGTNPPRPPLERSRSAWTRRPARPTPRPTSRGTRLRVHWRHGHRCRDRDRPRLREHHGLRHPRGRDLPGRATSCTGGAASPRTVTLGTDNVRETLAQCIARAQAQFPATPLQLRDPDRAVGVHTPHGHPPTPRPLRSARSARRPATWRPQRADQFPGRRRIYLHRRRQRGQRRDRSRLHGANLQHLQEPRIVDVRIPRPAPPRAAVAAYRASCNGSSVLNQLMNWTCPAGHLRTSRSTRRSRPTPRRSCRRPAARATDASGLAKRTNQTMQASACLTNQTMTATDSCLVNQAMKARSW
jgi:hypothetical protein